MAWGTKSRACIAGGLFLAAAACESPFATAPSVLPNTGVALNTSAPPTLSVESQNISKYFNRLQNNFLTQGMLRTDGGGPDVPFGRRNLVENFIQIALFSEYSTANGRVVQLSTENRLQRWEKPVRIRLEFGATVPEEQRAKDRASVKSFAARLARITGHPVSVVNENANFNVLILNEDERRAYGPRLRQLAPNMNDITVRAITRMPRSTSCLVYSAAYENAPNQYANAVAVIRGEHPDLWRLSCIHEELAQGMGLPNDSPAARPSIFNDDEEFALLTRHDELLLKILYDRRLRPGMTIQQARPVVEMIAGQLPGLAF